MENFIVKYVQFFNNYMTYIIMQPLAKTKMF